MTINWSVLGDLISYFAMLSLISFGGVSASLPDMHRYFVDHKHWMTSDEFARLFGIANAAPGPNMMVVGVLGYQVGGPVGAVLSFMAMAIPSSLFAYFVGGFWHRMRDRPWRVWVQAGLVPLTVGLLLASGYLLTVAADGYSWAAWLVSLGTIAFCLFTRAHPLWCLAVGALLGGFGLL